MRKVSGFTLIELIAVIAILGILAAVAIPKMFDTSTTARVAAANGFKASIEAAAVLNHAAKAAGSASATTVLSCTSAALGLLVSGGLPSSVTITGAAGTASGSTMICTLDYSAAGGSSSVEVRVIATSA